jgi:hypothetical protein
LIRDGHQVAAQAEKAAHLEHHKENADVRPRIARCP